MGLDAEGEMLWAPNDDVFQPFDTGIYNFHYFTL
jgi:hypothetical protein